MRCLINLSLKLIISPDHDACSCFYLCSGVGKKLVQQMEKHVKSKFGTDVVYLHARHYAVGFYEKLGYEKIGDEFEEVGMKHFKMQKQLT